MNAALELRGITKRFGATHVLNGVDLRVEASERGTRSSDRTVRASRRCSI